MLGVADQTPEVSGSGDDQQMIPLESCGVAVVSMGLLIEENQPVIWRGPMLNGIIRQFLYQVDWSERDVLVVDLPPGTGDAQLSLAQAVPMAGVVIVTTPQKVALQDARRGLAMFLQMGVPVLGVVENMSSFIPPDQPDRSYALFGSGGGQTLAEAFVLEERFLKRFQRSPPHAPRRRVIGASRAHSLSHLLVNALEQHHWLIGSGTVWSASTPKDTVLGLRNSQPLRFGHNS